jgi:hypothetical protein
VRSVAEVAEALRAGMVGMHSGPDPRFADDRVVTVAAAIGRVLRRATPVAAMDLGSEPPRVGGTCGKRIALP